MLAGRQIGQRRFVDGLCTGRGYVRLHTSEVLERRRLGEKDRIGTRVVVQVLWVHTSVALERRRLAEEDRIGTRLAVQVLGRMAMALRGVAYVEYAMTITIRFR